MATVDVEFDNAKPYSEIPGPSSFGMIRGFLPGGKFQHSNDIIAYLSAILSCNFHVKVNSHLRR